MKQAPRAWYKRLSNFLISKYFSIGKSYTTLFIIKKGVHIIVVQIYDGDIIFGTTNNSICEEFLSVCIVNLK